MKDQSRSTRNSCPLQTLVTDTTWGLLCKEEEPNKQPRFRTSGAHFLTPIPTIRLDLALTRLTQEVTQYHPESEKYQILEEIASALRFV